MQHILLLVTYQTKPNTREAFVEEVTDLGILQKIQKEDGFVAYQYYYDACQHLAFGRRMGVRSKTAGTFADSPHGRTTSSERKICLTDFGSQDLSIMQGMLTRHF